MLRRVHHINFVVRDLDKAVAHYSAAFALQAWYFEDHPKRPVKTARIRIGESWLVLVQPLDSDSAPARHLEKHGEGFFLLSFEVDDIDEAISSVENAGLSMLDLSPRQGILDWQVADIAPESCFGAHLQLVEEKNKPRNG